MKDTRVSMSKDKVRAYMQYHHLGVTAEDVANDFVVPREKAAKRLDELGYTKRIHTTIVPTKNSNKGYRTKNDRSKVEKVVVWS